MISPLLPRALLLGVLPLLAKAGCGLALDGRVGGPFPGVDAAGNVWLDQRLAEAPLADPEPGKPTPSLPLRAYWSPRLSLDAPPGPLGIRWYCPLMESTCRPSGPDTYELIKPDGYSQTLTVTRRTEAGREVFPRQLSGWNWKGTLGQNKEIRLAADCGASLSFDHRGRLTAASVDGRAYSWSYSGDKLQEIRCGSRPLFTFRYDSAGRLAGFTRPGERATVRFGDIPVALDKAQIITRPGLTRVEFENAGALAFDFGLDPVSGTASANFPELGQASWAIGNGKVKSINEFQFNIQHNPDCKDGVEITRNSPNSPPLHYSYNLKTGISIRPYSQDEELIEEIIQTGPNRRFLRKRSFRNIHTHKTTLINEYKYDQNHRIVYDYEKNRTPELVIYK